VALKGDRLLWTVVIVLLVIWALGTVSAVGGLIHLLLVIALIVILVRFIQGRRVI
jgi:uncharacterized protein DUF5670